MAFTTVGTLQNMYRYLPPPDIIWTKSVSNITDTFTMLSISGERAIASGSGTGMWYSNNGGVTWTQSTNINDALIDDGYYSLGMLSGLNGLAAVETTSITKRFVKTSDGGVTWTKVTQFDQDRTINALFITGQNGLYTSIAKEYPGYTINAGSSWTKSGGTGSANFDRLFMDGSYCLAACSFNSGANSITGIFYSSNGGATWGRSISLTSLYFTKIQIDSTGIGLATPASGEILYRSSNGGITWTASLTDERRIFALSGNKAVAINVSGNIVVIKYSTDKGATWLDSNYSAQCSSVSMEGNICIAITSAGGIIYSTDGGIKWSSSNLTGIVSLSTDTNAIIGKTDGGIYYSNNF
jgi:photosystem II stability/assembly factor-like uncharacterized protein